MKNNKYHTDTIQNYVIKSQTVRPSKHGGKITEITFYGVNDFVTWKTYVDTKNRNYCQWAYIIGRPNNGFIIAGLHVLDYTKCLLDADCVPIIVDEISDIKLALEKFELYMDGKVGKQVATIAHLFDE